MPRGQSARGNTGGRGLIRSKPRGIPGRFRTGINWKMISTNENVAAGGLSPSDWSDRVTWQSARPRVPLGVPFPVRSQVGLSSGVGIREMKSLEPICLLSAPRRTTITSRALIGGRSASSGASVTASVGREIDLPVCISAIRSTVNSRDGGNFNIFFLASRGRRERQPLVTEDEKF